MTDPTRLREAQRLVANALAFTPEPSRTCSVNWWNTASAAAFLIGWLIFILAIGRHWNG